MTGYTARACLRPRVHPHMRMLNHITDLHSARPRPCEVSVALARPGPVPAYSAGVISGERAGLRHAFACARHAYVFLRHA